MYCLAQLLLSFFWTHFRAKWSLWCCCGVIRPKYLQQIKLPPTEHLAILHLMPFGNTWSTTRELPTRWNLFQVLRIARAKPDTGFQSALPLHNITTMYITNVEGTRRCLLTHVKGQCKQQPSDTWKQKAGSASHCDQHTMSWACSLATNGTPGDCARPELDEINPTLGKSKASSGLPSLTLMVQGFSDASVVLSSTQGFPCSALHLQAVYPPKCILFKYFVLYCIKVLFTNNLWVLLLTGS